MNEKHWQKILDIAKQETNRANKLKAGTKEELKNAASKVGYELEDDTEGFLVKSYNGIPENKQINENFLAMKVASIEYTDKQPYTMKDKIKDFFLR